jgi:ABC-type uncharacterized transport system permease subunit
MNANLYLISCLAFLLYFYCSFRYYLHLRGRGEFAKRNLIGLGLLATVLHGYLLYRWIDTPFGQNLSLSHVFSLIAWLMCVLTLITALYKPIQNLSILILPLAALSVPLGVLFPGNAYFLTRLYPLQLTHILISIMAFGILGMAAFQAMLLHLQNRLLRSQYSETGLRFFPPLQTMETLLFQIIWLGFLCLSASLATAFFFLEDIRAISHIQKIIFSVLAWIFFAILLYGHHHSGWRGRTAIRWTLSGVILLIVAYFSSKLIVLKYCV